MKRTSYLILAAVLFWCIFMTGCTPEVRLTTDTPPKLRNTPTAPPFITQTSPSTNFKNLTLDDGFLQTIPPQDILKEVSIVPIGEDWECRFIGVDQPTLIEFTNMCAVELSNPSSYNIRRFDNVRVSSCGWAIGENVQITTSYPDGQIDIKNDIYGGVESIDVYLSTSEDTDYASNFL